MFPDTVITLWRVSLLTGRRTRLHNFYYRCDYGAAYKRTNVTAWESRGVILICFQHVLVFWTMHSRLFVYDCQYRVAAETEFMDQFGIQLGIRLTEPWWDPMAILSRGRWKSNDLDGWRIQFLSVFVMPNGPHDLKNISVNVAFDFHRSTGLRVVSYEDVVFEKNYTRSMTSGRYVACYAPVPLHKWALVFDTVTNKIRSVPDFFEFLAGENGTDELMVRYRNICPTDCVSPIVLNGRESVRMADMNREAITALNLSPFSRVIFRSTFQQPVTLRVLAAQAVLKIGPAVTSMKESEFLQSTGVDSKGHFE